MKSVKDLLKKKEGKSFQQDMFERHKYVSQEFQDYGYRMAAKLGDLKHKALYIKYAKEKPRAFLEQAFSFAIDYPNAKNRGKLFMWKIKELETERKKKLKEDKNNSPEKKKSKNKKK